VDIEEEWNYPVESSTEGDGTTVSANLEVSGRADAEVSLTATVRVAGVAPVYANVEAKAEYSFEGSIAASAGIEQEYDNSEEIWKGARKSKIFFVGVIPVEVYAQPKLTFDVAASASLEVGTEAGFFLRGGTSAGVTYDPDREEEFQTFFLRPDQEGDFREPRLASFEASTGLTLSMDAGLYGGLVEANIGVRGAMGAELTAGTEEEAVLDVSLVFSIPLSANALYGQFEIGSTSLGEFTVL